LHYSAPHHNGEIVNRRNHLHFVEDDLFTAGSTAVLGMKATPRAKIDGNALFRPHLPIIIVLWRTLADGK
jgi:hypothetical protein